MCYGGYTNVFRLGGGEAMGGRGYFGGVGRVASSHAPAAGGARRAALAATSTSPTPLSSRAALPPAGRPPHGDRGERGKSPQYTVNGHRDCRKLTFHEN